MLTGIIATQSTDMQYIILFFNISAIDKTKKALDQLIYLLKTLPDVRWKLLVHACSIRLPALTKSCAWIGLLSTSCYVTTSSLSACGQFQTSGWKRRQWWEFGKNSYLPSSIPWFQARADFMCCNLTCYQTEIWLWERPLWKKASLLAAIFSVDMPFTNMVDCISSMLRAGVEQYILPKNYYVSWMVP